MTTVVSTDDPRTAKARALAASSGQWLKITDRETGALSFGIRSSDGRRLYHTTRESCSCPDRGHRGVVCCHMLAVRMVCEAAQAVEGNQARQGQQPRRSPAALAALRALVAND